MNKQNQLTEIHHSGKPYIIYKSKKGFKLFTDFSKKIILNNKNLKNFLGKKQKGKTKNTDLFIGFFTGFFLIFVGVVLEPQGPRIWTGDLLGIILK